jgi:hypothetical protein
VILVNKVSKVRRAILAHRVSKDHSVSLVNKASKDPKVPPVLLDRPVGT